MPWHSSHGSRPRQRRLNIAIDRRRWPSVRPANQDAYLPPVGREVLNCGEADEKADARRVQGLCAPYCCAASNVLQVERLPDFSPVVNLHARLGTSDGVYALPWRTLAKQVVTGLFGHEVAFPSNHYTLCAQSPRRRFSRTIPPTGARLKFLILEQRFNILRIFSVRPVSLKWVLDSDLSALTDVPSCPFTLVPTKPARPPELT